MGAKNFRHTWEQQGLEASRLCSLEMKSIADFLVFSPNQWIVDIPFTVQKSQQLQGLVVPILRKKPPRALGHPEQKTQTQQ